MKEITWKISTGKEAKVSVDLLTSKSLSADGDKIEVPCCEIQIFASVEGMGKVGSGRPTNAPHPFAGKIGKLGISSENLDRIKTAIAEIEATPEWQAKLSRIAKAEKETAEYDAHRSMMRRVMGY